jgi:hypothetical protein
VLDLIETQESGLPMFDQLVTILIPLIRFDHLGIGKTFNLGQPGARVELQDPSFWSGWLLMDWKFFTYPETRTTSFQPEPDDIVKRCHEDVLNAPA